MLLLYYMKFCYKYKRNEVPGYFASLNLHTQGSSHDFNKYQRDDIRTNSARISLTEKMSSELFAENNKFSFKSNLIPCRHP